MKKLFIITSLYLLASCQTDEDLADAYGNFEADETVISAQAAGELLVFTVNEGETLTAATQVGIIDSTTLYNQKLEILANREAILVQKTNVGAELRVLTVEQANVDRELKRVEKLVASDAATTKQLDDLKGNLAVLSSKKSVLNNQYKVIDAQVAAVSAKLALVQDQIDKCTVVNPITGTVLAKLVQPHEIVGPGKPLYKLADLTQIYLKAYISEPQLGQVKLAQQVNVQIDLGAGVEDHSGTISWISSEAEFTPKIIQTKEERVNLVYAIKVRVENLQGVLKLGMPGEVYF